MKQEINVLVVDDSAWMRKIITEAIEQIPGMTVIGKARNGEVALKMLETLRPDVLTLDLEMPVLNGLDTLLKLKAADRDDVKVIMLSSTNDRKKTMEALELGAVDFIMKPENILHNYDAFQKKLERHITLLFDEKMEPKKISQSNIRKHADHGRVEAIVIGASTGGPRTLVSLMQDLPQNDTIPIFIVQHMPEGFTASFAERLNQLSTVPVVEAKDGMPIEGGVVYLAPGGSHMVLESGFIRLNKQKKVHGVRPAVDHLFISAASIYGNGLVGFVLTGMGKDGTEGCRHILSAGGYTLAQNRETSVVFGMPRAAIEEGQICEVAGVEELSARLNRMVEEKTWN